MIVNRQKTTAILDTGSPIIIRPRSYGKCEKLKTKGKPPTDRKFVDLIGNGSQNQECVHVRNIDLGSHERISLVAGGR